MLLVPSGQRTSLFELIDTMLRHRAMHTEGCVEVERTPRVERLVVRDHDLSAVAISDGT
jgi:hypothetical protein